MGRYCPTLARFEAGSDKVGLHRRLPAGDGDARDERRYLMDLLSEAVEANHLAQGSAVAGADLDADVAVGALVLVDHHPMVAIEIKGHLRARLDADAATVALVDRVRVVAGDAIEVAPL